MFVMSILCSDLKFVLIFFILLYVFCLLLKRFMFLLLYIYVLFLKTMMVSKQIKHFEWLNNHLQFILEATKI